MCTSTSWAPCGLSRILSYCQLSFYQLISRPELDRVLQIAARVLLQTDWVMWVKYLLRHLV